jgi:CubicO group peptidase (beta-lactamase class C family)
LLRDGFGSHWFGFGQHADPESFGHAGIDTVMTVAEPRARLTISFLTTASHPDPEEVIRVRNRATDLVMEALA